jgi:hypothetical protein
MRRNNFLATALAALVTFILLSAFVRPGHWGWRHGWHHNWRHHHYYEDEYRTGRPPGEGYRQQGPFIDSNKSR